MTAPGVIYRPHRSRRGDGYHVYADGRFYGFVDRVHDGRWLWRGQHYDPVSRRIEYVYGETRASAAAQLIESWDGNPAPAVT